MKLRAGERNLTVLPTRTSQIQFEQRLILELFLAGCTGPPEAHRRYSDGHCQGAVSSFDLPLSINLGAMQAGKRAPRVTKCD